MHNRHNISKPCILIAGNSLMYRKMFTLAVMEASKESAIACAADIGKAISLIKHNHYDIIIIDAETPGPPLIDFLKEIIPKTHNSYILITSQSLSGKSEFLRSEFSEYAVEHMVKPTGGCYEENLKTIKQKIADIVALFRHNSERKSRKTNNEPETAVKTEKPETTLNNKNKSIKKINFSPELVLIAVSTGGPKTLGTILPKINKNFPVPILIVQHINRPFSYVLAQRLNSLSQLKVKVAESGEIISAGTIYFAPGGTHMMLDAENKVYFDDSAPVNGVRPAADVLFESIAENSRAKNFLVVILTGMGSDGKKGLSKLKEKKECYCLAQSEKTCVVYGMPSAVAESGMADMILDLDTIPSEIESFKYLPIKN